MAAADYRLCDVCDGKAFYDANLNYDYDSDTERPRVTGEASYGPPLDYLGDWAVLCTDCAKRYRTKIVPIEEEPT